ncbi:50S ribosomal protein L20 [Deferribacter autotrophicus]|uniref:Large ribosomal subunit protein bL20 n=1 Tax=Deferribacter autotrophicus TaxID=500465 RepID=A0A5A8F024_9BACT|nr:50S ribosomal protein L20 [Deferribacter autotrophicus]KAA0257013.1 50S ribosomal protein L20 [Deferribacter autotrophicus]
MPRAKGGFKTRRRRKKWLKLTKGFRGAANNVYRKSREAAERALVYAYRDRKQRKREFRKLWIIRINAAVRQYGLSYSKFMGLLKKNNVEINRKVLSEMAIHNPEEFEKLVKKVTG